MLIGVTLLSQLIFKGEELLATGVTNFHCPILMTHGSSDTLTDPTATKEFFEKCPSKDKELKIFEGYYHEMHNEPEEFRKPVYETYSRWLLARI